MAEARQYQYEDLEAEYKACQQQLRSKEQALKIYQEQLRNSDINFQKLKQEVNQLRSQLARSQPVPAPSKAQESSAAGSVGSSVSEERIREREKYISQLEESQEKISELQRQVQLLEDEKEELSCERDYYSGKCDSLLKCLEEERNTQQPSHTTVQTLIEENRKLKLDIVEVQAERDHALSRIERYKKAAERRKAMELAANQGTVGDKKQDLKQSQKRVRELEELANSLSESVKEKSVALTHQKKANKMLATRIAELEHRLKVQEISGLWSNAESLLPEVGQSPLSPDIVDLNSPVTNKRKEPTSGSCEPNDITMSSNITVNQ